jgi:hypothetical protein
VVELFIVIFLWGQSNNLRVTQKGAGVRQNITDSSTYCSFKHSFQCFFEVKSLSEIKTRLSNTLSIYVLPFTVQSILGLKITYYEKKNVTLVTQKSAEKVSHII